MAAFLEAEFAAIFPNAPAFSGKRQKEPGRRPKTIVSCNVELVSSSQHCDIRALGHDVLFLLGIAVP